MNNLLSQSFNFSQLPRVRDVSTPHGEEGGEGPGMDLSTFNADVAQAEEQIDLLSRAVRDLKALHEESKATVSANAVKRVNARLQKSVAEAAKQAKAIRDRIERISKSNESSRSHPGCHKGSATDRHRSAVTLSLARSLKAALEGFNAVRASMDRQERATLARRVQVLTGQELGDAELDRLMRAGQGEEVLRQAVAQQGAVSAHALRNAVLEIEERRAAVSEITRSLQELHQLVLDMSVLVEQQQEVLDQIEVHVGDAHEEVKAGGVQLVKAERTRRNTRKWVCVGVLALLIIMLIIAIPIIIQSLH